MNPIRRKVLYISYDGLLDPLGFSQVFRYLKALSQCHEISLISFEKNEALKRSDEFQALRLELQRLGIEWRPLRYHKTPTAPATAFDILHGLGVGAYLVLRHKIEIVHARSYVSAVIALALKKIFGLKFIFDMRGFWADEKVDSGSWNRHSKLYAVAKTFERQFLLSADYVVSLTQAGIDCIRKFEYMQDRPFVGEVITTCADLDSFKPGVRDPEFKGRFVLGYVGAVGLWYDFEAAIAAFLTLLTDFSELQPLFFILNQGEHDVILKKLASAAVPKDKVILRSVPSSKMPTEMAKIDACVFFIKPYFSKQASAPTKLGELLGLGIPVLSNRGVGDMESILLSEGVGVLISGFGAEEVRAGTRTLVELAGSSGIRDKCRNAAMCRFSLKEGVEAYDRIYRRLL